MGFYGNITNTTSSQFTFDKVYPNRQTMDAGVKTDGVYVNRFVLIEYDTEVALNNKMTKVYSVKNGVAYSTESNENDLEYITNGMVKNNPNLIIIYTATMDHSQYPPIEKDLKFYRYSKTNDGDDGAASYLPISEKDTDSNYIKNYGIDIGAYPDAKRGYDSTVWQKLYVNNEEKYVMIAELNSVVPTFDVSPDAPTMNPIAPHFDANSTNVYYKLHWQAPWGFRVAKASDGNPSDGETTWTTYTYNEITNTHTEIKDEKVPAAIYYNKKAFAPQVNKANTDPNNIDGRVEGEDEIKVTPTGISGNKYNKHDGTADLDVAADIQEMTINLPSIGNMMSDAWDIIHGPLRNDSKTESLQGILNAFEGIGSNQIPYKRKLNGEIVGADLTENDWISATLDDDNQKINIVHKGSNTIETIDNSTSIDFNNEASGNQFSSYALEETDKGHVKKVKRTPIILPNGFNEIKTANGNSLVAATTPRSAFKIATDDWIHVEKPEGTNDTLKLYHEAHTQQWELKKINESKSEESFTFCTFDEANSTGHMDYYYQAQVFFPKSFSKVETDEENSSITAGAVNSTFKIGGDNTWTETEIDDNNNKILVKHKAKEKPLKEKYYDDDSYTDTFFDAKIDAAGHITEYKQKNIPASLSIIYAHEPNKTEPFKISASSAPGGRSVDIFGDSFIKLKGKTTTEGSYSYNSGFVINHALTDEFQVSSSVQPDAKEITTYNDYYDPAGHRTGRVQTTYKLPNYYSAIEIPAEGGSTLITPNTGGSIILEGKSEDIKIGDNTKTTTNWITVSGDKDSNTILIDHSNPNSEDPNQTEVNPTEFAQVPYFSYDSKGHITASGFNNLVGDDWLSWEKNNADIKVSHGKAVMPKSGSWNIAGRSDNPSNPGPGSTITVPYIEFDDKGHINHVDNVEVTMPLTTTAAVVSIDNSDYRDDNTLIIKKLESETNGPIIKPKYITTDDLKLYGYTTKETVSATESLKIGSEDTINSAIEKLEYRIDKIPSETEIYDNVFNGTDTQVLETLTYQDHKLVPRYHTTDTFKINGYRNTSMDPREQVDDGDTINSALKKIVFQISSIGIADKNSPYVKVRGYTEQSIYDDPIYYPEKEGLQVINNGMTLNEALSLIEENIRILCFRISSLYGQQRTIESSFTEDEIEQIANNLDNV